MLSLTAVLREQARPLEPDHAWIVSDLHLSVGGAVKRGLGARANRRCVRYSATTLVHGLLSCCGLLMSVEVQNRLNVPSRQATGDKSLALSLIFGLTENHGGFSVWPIHHSAVGWPPVRCTASYVFVQVPRSANRPFDSGVQGERNKQERAAVLERMARRVGQRFWMEPAHG